MSKNFKKRPSPLSSGVFMDNWLHKKVHHQAPETIVNNDEETEGNDSLTMDAHLQPVEEEVHSRASLPDDLCSDLMQLAAATQRLLEVLTQQSSLDAYNIVFQSKDSVLFEQYQKAKLIVFSVSRMLIINSIRSGLIHEWT
jgi:hypothetical protein